LATTTPAFLGIRPDQRKRCHETRQAGEDAAYLLS